MMRWTWWGILVLWLGSSVVMAQQATLLYSDPLDDASSTSVGPLTNNGGAFIAERGWQSVDDNSQLLISLPANLPESGSMLVDVTNFDPVSQNSNIKHQIISLYSRVDGSKANWDDPGKSWWNIRTGTGYMDSDTQAGFKFLAAPGGIDSREEVRIMQDATWDLNRTYTFKVSWSTTDISFYLDGDLKATLDFTGQTEPFQYIFLGTDNVYIGQAGPVYSNLRIYGEGEVPVPVEPGAVQFSDITDDARIIGYSPDGYPHSVSFADIDQDGWSDLFVGHASALELTPTLLYYNEGLGFFDEQSMFRGLDEDGMTTGIVNADFDGDGDLDLFLGRMTYDGLDYNGPNRLFFNDGYGYYDVTDSSGLSPESNNTRGSIALDVEGDGDLDLYLVNWGQPNELYINDGSGTFTLANSGAEGPDDDPSVYGQLGVTAGDVDSDGDVDIYVCRRQNDSQPSSNLLFINDGTGNFTEEAQSRGVAVGGRSHGPVFSDADADGDLDLFVVNYAFPGGGVPKLGVYFNDGTGHFTDRTDQVNIEVSGYHALLGDVDNDGDPDLYVLKNADKDVGAKPTLYLNDGTGQFGLEPGTGLEVDGRDTRGGGAADIDADGDLDFAVTFQESGTRLLRNDTDNGNQYIQVACVGPNGEAAGIGSKVKVYEPGFIGDDNYLLGYQEVVSNSGYLSQSSSTLHFGLGSLGVCDIRIIQSDGSQHDFTGIQANQLFRMPPPVQYHLTKVSGDSQIAEPGTVLPEPLTVQVLDDQDNPVADVPVTFSFGTGSGSFDADSVQVTDSNGLVSIGVQLGTDYGRYEILAKNDNAGNSPVMFVATTPEPPPTYTRISDEQSGMAGTPLADSVGVRVTDVLGQPIPNFPLTFWVTHSSGRVNGDSSTTLLTDTDGTARLQWTLKTVVGADSLWMTSSFAPQDTLLFTATVQAGPAFYLSKVDSTDRTITPGQPFDAPFNVRVTDEYSNPVAGHPVTFQVEEGGGDLQNEAAVQVDTDSTGLASVIWTAGPWLGPDQVLSASSALDGTLLEGSPVTWRVSLDRQVDPATSQITATSPVEADGVMTSSITVVLKDANGDPMGAGYRVDVMASGTDNQLTQADTLTDDNGELSATLASTVAETKIVRARILGLDVVVSDSAVVEFQPVEREPSSLVKTGGDEQAGVVGSNLPEPLTVQVLDTWQRPVAFTPVDFEVVSNQGVLLGQKTLTAQSDSNGIAEVILSLGEQAGINNHQVVVTVPGVKDTLNFYASAVADNPKQLTVVSGDSQVVFPNQELPEPLGVEARDKYGNPCPDQPVQFSALDEGMVLSQQPAQTDTLGRAFASVTAGETPGTHRFQASLGSDLSVTFVTIVEPIVQNHPPVIETFRDTVIYENQPLNALVQVTDPDDDSLSVRIEGLPEEAGLARADEGWYVQWTPTFDDSGRYTIRIVAEDAPGDSAVWNASLQVLNVNRAPMILTAEPADTSLTAQYGIELSFSVNAFDADGDTLQYHWTVNGEAHTGDQTFSFVPDSEGPSHVTVRVEIDDGNDSVVRSWELTLNPVAVELSGFQAFPTNRHETRVVWQVTRQTDVRGYIVSKSTRRTGPFERASSFIHMQEDERRYEWKDPDPGVAGTTVYYQLEAHHTDGSVETFGPVSVAVAVPDRMSLAQNYPNPFNPSTQIVFELPSRMDVTLAVYNTSGQRVATLVAGQLDAGVHSVTWTARGEMGNVLPSGLYFYRLHTPSGIKTRRLMLMK
jgi:hypothetical protein